MLLAERIGHAGLRCKSPHFNAPLARRRGRGIERDPWIGVTSTSTGERGFFLMNV